jgi:dephospho-CoA kinase
MIIAVVGMPGAGKSVFCDILKERGYPIVYFGGQVLKEVKRRGLSVSPENERIVRQELRKTHGMDAMAKLALPELREFIAQGRKVAIDGVYSFSEFRTLKAEFEDALVVVAVVTPRGLRHDRLSRRPQRPLTHEQANSRDYLEIDTMEKGGPIAIADYYIVNNRDETNFRREIGELLTQIEREYGSPQGELFSGGQEEESP